MSQSDEASSVSDHGGVDPYVGGAANPRALAELVLGRRVPWHRLADPKAVVEGILQTPMSQMASPLSRSVVHSTPVLDRRRGRLDLEECTIPGAPQPPGFERFGWFDPDRVRSALRHAVEGSTGEAVSGGDTDMRYDWIDVGGFFNEAAESTDPRQGSVGDCWFIAALSSVAWSMPSVISHRTVRTGMAQTDFSDVITLRFANWQQIVYIDLYEAWPEWPLGTSSIVTKANRITEPTDVVVDEKLQHKRAGGPGKGNPGDLIGARPNEEGEIWPAIYEKAQALHSQRTLDPNYNEGDEIELYVLGGGRPLRALYGLTGIGPLVSRKCASSDPIDLFHFVQKRCDTWGNIPRPPRYPIVASTYTDEDDAPDLQPGDYAAAGLYGDHTYSVLGWTPGPWLYPYLILRNPWGHTVPHPGQVPGVLAFTHWGCYDGSYLRNEELGDASGIFGLTPATFKRYFREIGSVGPKYLPDSDAEVVAP